MPPRFTTRLTFASAIALGGVALVTASPPAGASGKTTTVTAVETDFHIALSKKTFTPGAYVFVVENKGATTHALTITGPGLTNASSRNINPGQHTTLKVTLKKGRYDVYCPVPGHKQLGMNLDLSVGPGTAISTSSSQGTAAGSSASSPSSGGSSF